MIAYLRGKIINKGQGFIILVVNNTGYLVYVNLTMHADFDIGQETELYTHQYVREDALDLYGFKSLEELEMFELLLSISGIGPKSALGVLSIADLEQLKETIAQGDSSLLTKVSGIGRKTAERVVLELREKIIKSTGSRKQEAGQAQAMTSGDEIDALMALGYSMMQAREALRLVDVKIKDSGERIKQALRKLSK